jgi:hypothetical protein
MSQTTTSYDAGDVPLSSWLLHLGINRYNGQNGTTPDDEGSGPDNL